MPSTAGMGFSPIITSQTTVTCISVSCSSLALGPSRRLMCMLAGCLVLQVHVRHMPTAQNTHLGQNWLADLTAAWKEAGLWITRAKVRVSERFASLQRQMACVVVSCKAAACFPFLCCFVIVELIFVHSADVRGRHACANCCILFPLLATGARVRGPRPHAVCHGQQRPAARPPQGTVSMPARRRPAAGAAGRPAAWRVTLSNARNGCCSSCCCWQQGSCRRG